MEDSSSIIKIAGQIEVTATFAGAISKNDPVYLTGTYNLDVPLIVPSSVVTNMGASASTLSPTFSNNGNYSVDDLSAVSPYMAIFKRNGDYFYRLPDVASPPYVPGASSLQIYDFSFSADDVYLALAMYGYSPFMAIYKRSGDTFTKLANPDILPTNNGQGVSFSSDGVYLAVAHYTYPFITLYKRGGDTFTKLANPNILPTDIATGVSFSPDGIYLAVLVSATTPIIIYKRNGDTFTKLADPGVMPVGQSQSVVFNEDGTYLAVGHVNSPFITIYKRSGDTFTKLADPNVLPTNCPKGLAFSVGTTYLSCTSNTSPYLTIYKLSG